MCPSLPVPPIALMAEMAVVVLILLSAAVTSGMSMRGPLRGLMTAGSDHLVSTSCLWTVFGLRPPPPALLLPSVPRILKASPVEVVFFMVVVVAVRSLVEALALRVHRQSRPRGALSSLPPCLVGLCRIIAAADRLPPLLLTPQRLFVASSRAFRRAAVPAAHLLLLIIAFLLLLCRLFTAPRDLHRCLDLHSINSMAALLLPPELFTALRFFP